ncbi:NADH-quinone oxidoreductase subunit D [Polyangium jinanense]|uniref:NADH-quinone oxidoreductase subunit D n=1 Tax=Polyangium jinanense TaxID=2829994 RepID=A0A9X3X046_9BACT|nr:NADH-quinone oxidoreductase subunit D [Polyangium jinanense]MDC3952502.1 NADH-quinone oxidoreductase subunit D [Polyangium jinanense]MDC3980130.1 NADH-quinone oxidoreductase subunit D [Polyangium jinanense]
MEPLDRDLEEGLLELPSEPMMLNMGPSHPAMHGTVRIVLELSGEMIQKADVQIGYLHRGFEKMCERGTWTQIFPYVDRCNYVSPMLNNVGFALAVEKMLGVTVPERCQYYRVALGELARICDHMICSGAMCMELGAFTPFLYFARAREIIWDIFEEETGARVTHSFGRVGGMANPPTKYFKDMVRAGVPRVLQLISEGEKLLLKNRIFLDRLEGVGVMSKEDALALGWTGVVLRASGVPYDVRRAHPYMVYDRMEFDVPVGTTGDNYDRFMCRQEEIRQTARIIEQALDQMPDEGPINIDDPRIVLPPKQDVYTTIEATIQHFKIVMEGIKVPAGECYSYTEAGNGELGFYLVSDGSGTPYRVRIRPPCFATTQGLEQLITGLMIPDVVPTFGSLNMIGGECDH